MIFIQYFLIATPNPFIAAVSPPVVAVAVAWEAESAAVAKAVLACSTVRP